MLTQHANTSATIAVDLSHYLTAAELHQLVSRAIDEDLGRGDLTSDTLVPPDLRATASLCARDAGVIAGLDIAALVFTIVDPTTTFEPLVRDGATVEPGQPIAHVHGAARSLLRAERVALNFVQRLSGCASLTARYIAAVRGTRARIVDTRKTTPGLRALEKYAVRMGGGRNHRRDLGDAVLIKDNHLVALAARGVTLAEALAEARDALPHTVTIEVEVDRLDQIAAALDAWVDCILLDNMSPAQLRQAVRLIDGRALTEASGGINLATIAEIAATGVDLISIGALTHSAAALDIGLDFGWE